MSLRHGLLGLLNYRKMTGYELDKAFKDSLGFFWQAQTSQIYRELNAMEKLNWLSSEIEIQSGKPNKKIYSLTDTGKSELIKWLSEGNFDEGLKIRSEFLVRLFFSGERSVQENIEMLKAFKSYCSHAFAGLSQADSNIEHYSSEINDGGNIKAVYWGMTALFGKLYMSMCADFAEQSIKTLEEYL